MPHHMHPFGVSAIQNKAPRSRPSFARRLICNVLRFFDRQKLAACRRQRWLVRAQERRYDDVFTIYPPSLADLKRRCDGGAG